MKNHAFKIFQIDEKTQAKDSYGVLKTFEIENDAIQNMKKRKREELKSRRAVL